jgi:hypothetical protein
MDFQSFNCRKAHPGILFSLVLLLLILSCPATGEATGGEEWNLLLFKKKYIIIYLFKELDFIKEVGNVPCP